MVYELFQDCFVPNDFANDFDFFLKYVNTLFMVMFSINITHACCIATIGFGKQAKGIRPITIGEVIYRLITHTLAI